MLKNCKTILIIFLLGIIIIGPLKILAKESIYKYSLKFLSEAATPKIIKLIDLGKKNGVVKKGILFTVRAKRSDRVQIAGNFSNWTPRTMEKGKNNIWYYFLAASQEKPVIKYKFNINNVWIPDPLNYERIDDKYGSFVSIVNNIKPTEGRQVTFQILEDNLIEFRIFNPNASYISIVGDFNNWNPENDILTKGDDNIWRLKKHIEAGKYRYKYVIDGKWSLDIYNKKSASDKTGGIASLLEVK